MARPKIFYLATMNIVFQGRSLDDNPNNFLNFLLELAKKDTLILPSNNTKELEKRFLARIDPNHRKKLKNY